VFTKTPSQAPTRYRQTERAAASHATASDRVVGIELGRILACLAVIFIHQQSSNYGVHHTLREALDVVSRWAVPYFFIIAGYFMPWGKGWVEVAIKYIVRLVPIFLFWVTAYAVYVGKPYWFLSDFWSIWKTLVTGGAGFHLWFLPSLGVCVILTAIILNYASVRILLLVAIALYVFGLMHASYEAVRVGLAYDRIDRSFNPRNGPFMGLLRLKFQVQHPRPSGHRMLQWTNDTSTSTARNVA
jgi:surface polysaccharide O-acyltransferase-like enzyme